MGQQLKGYAERGRTSNIREVTIIEDAVNDKVGIDVNLQSEGASAKLSNDVRNLSVLDLLSQILRELQINNTHQEIITGDVIQENEIQR